MVYTYRMPWGETLRLDMDLSRAEQSIYYEAEAGEWVVTPYQTADARHLETVALRLVVQYLGAEWYADESSRRSDEQQLDAAVRHADLVESES